MKKPRRQIRVARSRRLGRTASTDPTQAARWRRAGELLRTGLATVAVLALYFTVPLASGEFSAFGRLIGASIALVVLGYAIVQVIRQRSNLSRLIVLFVVVAAVFSALFFVIARNWPGSFEGLDTRIDALYFTLTTMTTTGYGDIHAVGQVARVLVSAVFVFDFVFIGLVAGELSRHVERSRIAARTIVSATAVATTTTSEGGNETTTATTTQTSITTDPGVTGGEDEDIEGPAGRAGDPDGVGNERGPA